MNFANLHQNFILLSPLTLNQHLDNHGFWPAFIAEATPFARNITGTPRINAGQFDGGKAIKHGRLSWRDETLQNSPATTTAAPGRTPSISTSSPPNSPPPPPAPNKTPPPP